MSGVSNAAEDDQATVRPTSFGLRSPRTADKRERGDAGKALARRGWPCWCAGLPNARRGHWSRLVHEGPRELEGDRTLGASIVRARRRDRLLWTYTEEGAAAFYPLAVVPLARGAERPQGQREITGARRQADPCVH